jgi:hypothetical protein
MASLRSQFAPEIDGGRKGETKHDLCGTNDRDEVIQGIGPRSCEDRIFRVLDLCIDVDPSSMTVKLHGPSLEILVEKAQATSRQEAEAVAA